MLKKLAHKRHVSPQTLENLIQAVQRKQLEVPQPNDRDEARQWLEAMADVSLSDCRIRQSEYQLLNQVGESFGYQAVPIMGLGVEDVLDRDAIPEVLLDELSSLVRPGGHNTILMDHRKGRKTEASLINGLVATELQRLGRDNSVNAAIAEVSARVTRGEIETAMTNLDLVLALCPPE